MSDLTYTLFDADGCPLARGMTVEDASDCILAAVCRSDIVTTDRDPDADADGMEAWRLNRRSTIYETSGRPVGDLPPVLLPPGADDDVVWRAFAPHIVASSWGPRAPYALAGDAADAAVAEYERDARLDEAHERAEAAILRRAQI